MSERDVRLSEQVEARKRATWSEIEARADARESIRRAGRVGVLVLAVAGLALIANRYVPNEPQRSASPSQSTAPPTLQSTAQITIVRDGGGRPAIEHVAGGGSNVAVEYVGDGDMLAFLRESGLPATLIRIGTEVRVAFHQVPADAPPGSGRSLPVDPTAATQNF
jgi:hypothetical protein